MRQTEQNSSIAGFFGTILIWTLIFLFFYFGAVLFKPKEFKTIKIRLDSAQKIAKGEGESLPPASHSVAPTPPSPKGQRPLKSPENPSLQENEPRLFAEKSLVSDSERPTPPKTSQKSESKKNENSTVKKSEPKKSETKSANKKNAVVEPVRSQNELQTTIPKPAEQTLQKSIDELMAEQQKPKTTPKKAFDWSMFDEMEGNSSSSNAVAKNVPSPASNQSALSGSAASSSSQNSTAAASSSQNAKSASGQQASSATTNALASAASAKKYSLSSGDVSSVVTVSTFSADSGISLQMTDGSSRMLLEPAEPKISLSGAASALIDSTKRLTISFTVTASGNVPVSGIKISPDILPQIISMEIREQIARWRFQSAPSDGFARFDYTIQKR